MSTLSIISLTLAVVTVVAATFGFTVYFRYSIRLKERELRLQEMTIEGEYSLARRKGNQSDDSILRQLVFQQNEVLEQLRRTQQNIYVDVSGRGPTAAEADRNDAPDYTSLMKELSHSLNTPLSQVEAIVLRGQNLGGELIADDLSKIKAAIDISKSFLVAFRDLANVADSAVGWNAESLREALTSAAEVYRDSLHREDVDVSIEVPSRIPQYANSYILSIILPILENAIESAVDKGGVFVTHGLEGADEANPVRAVIEVEGRSNVSPVISDEIYSPGFTTKDNHDGLGLTVAKRLVSMTSGASISHNVVGDNVVFRVTLPMERSE